jgi:hypothetical protein
MLCDVHADKRDNCFVNGKPVERRGRKVTGLQGKHPRVAGLPKQKPWISSSMDAAILWEMVASPSLY